MRNVQWISHSQPHVTVNARAGIPAAVRLLGIVHAHRDGIGLVAVVQIRRQVILEAEIAKGIVSEMMAVDPDIAIPIDSVKLYDDFLPRNLANAKKYLR